MIHISFPFFQAPSEPEIVTILRTVPPLPALFSLQILPHFCTRVSPPLLLRTLRELFDRYEHPLGQPSDEKKDDEVFSVRRTIGSSNGIPPIVDSEG